MMSPQETRVMDINAEFLGVPTATLMKNAGSAIAKVVDERYEKGEVTVICGTGNNGGDGFVAARYLDQMSWKVKVLLLKGSDNIRTELAMSNFKKMRGHISVIENADVSELEGASLIIDAMLGTGMSGSIREPYRKWIGYLNGSGNKIVSIDVPSGFGADLAVRPALTIALHDVKDGMDETNSGQIVVKDIGIPSEAVDFVGPGEFAYYPIPEGDSHKGQNGRVLVIGGGPYTGAPALSGMAAYAAGCDLVTIAAPENCRDVIASYSPNYIVKPLAGDKIGQEHVDYLKELANEADALVIGPGAGDDVHTLHTLREVIASTDKPMIIDADGLASLVGQHDILKGKGVVLTPHKAEFRKLAGVGDNAISEDVVKRLAAKFGATVILKGAVDIITDGTNTKKNRTGNPGMTVGGTGDVLAGLVGGLLSKGVAPYNAARIAAYLSGSAGDLAFEEMSYSMTALDVIYNVPEVLKECLEYFSL